MPYGESTQNANEVEVAPHPPTTGYNGDGRPKRPRRPKGPKSGPPGPPERKSESSTTGKGHQPISAESAKVLLNLGLDLSGRDEVIPSRVKTDAFMRLASESWNQLITARPTITKIFSAAEWRHVYALLLTWRIEHVHYDATGSKPSAPTRVPIPRNTRLFHPLWEVLSCVGIVTDHELGQKFVPAPSLPSTKEADTEDDLNRLIECSLYDWKRSWFEVEQARALRSKPEQCRELKADGYSASMTVVESITSGFDRQKLLNTLRAIRWLTTAVSTFKHLSEFEKLCDYGLGLPAGTCFAWASKFNFFEISAHGDDITELKIFPEKMREAEDSVLHQIRNDKRKKMEARPIITPKLSFMVSGKDELEPGAYGAWLHWDPQLWLDYQQVVDDLSNCALFSLSPPNEVAGVYSWVLPVVEDSDGFYARLPKRSVPPPHWIVATLVPMSLLPEARHAAWYVRGDMISFPLMIINKWIRAAIKVPFASQIYGDVP